mmetsp:Transcript_39176/g.63533  ORF Transcript_39176/g.63533 Transcript_39176/m.63533 type:complete len:560 (+) Transcript_39176:243-1922(+)
MDSVQRRAVCEADRGEHLFITGGAGTGKSFVLNEVIKSLKDLHGKDAVAVTAPTWLAALRIGGTTINEWAGIGTGKEPKEALAHRVRGKMASRVRWVKCKVIVLDEVSQLDGRLLDTLVFVARKTRPAKFSKLPIAGIQLIFCGDFAQLPPCPDKAGKFTFAFESRTWKEIFGEKNTRGIITLTKNYRIDPQSRLLQKYLDEMRLAKLSGAGEAFFRSLSDKSEHGKAHIQLCSRNSTVRRINHDRIQSICTQSKEKVHSFHAKDVIPCTRLPNLDDFSLIPANLDLVCGVQVILSQTLDAKRQLVNGVRGVIVGFEEEKMDDGKKVTDPVILFSLPNGKTIKTKMHSTPNRIRIGQETIAIRNQIPIVPAYAFTIHKAQGMEFSQLLVDMANIFEYGQAYTALTRATNESGLIVHNFSARMIRVHPKVVAFYNNISTSYLEGELPPKKQPKHEAVSPENSTKQAKVVQAPEKPAEDDDSFVPKVVEFCSNLSTSYPECELPPKKRPKHKTMFAENYPKQAKVVQAPEKPAEDDDSFEIVTIDDSDDSNPSFVEETPPY